MSNERKMAPLQVVISALMHLQKKTWFSDKCEWGFNSVETKFSYFTGFKGSV